MSGKFISYKSKLSDKEINEAGKAIDLLGGNINNKTIVSLPCSDIKRTFVTIEKKKILLLIFQEKQEYHQRSQLNEVNNVT